MNMSVVGIAGSDIRDGNIKLTLALLWQMMKKHTFSLLQQCNKSESPFTETQIVEWVNKTLSEGGKRTRISGFKDRCIATSVVILDLIDALRPNAVNYTLATGGNDDNQKLLNANYALSLARKIGAMVFVLPDDIVQMKSTMVMTVFACLMVRALIQDVEQNYEGSDTPAAKPT